MKKIIALIVAALMLLSLLALVSCGDKKKSSSGNSDSTEAQTSDSKAPSEKKDDNNDKKDNDEKKEEKPVENNDDDDDISDFVGTWEYTGKDEEGCDESIVIKIDRNGNCNYKYYNDGELYEEADGELREYEGNLVIFISDEDYIDIRVGGSTMTLFPAEGEFYVLNRVG